KPNFIRF
uniref:FMRFamide-like neuropeptide PF4 n=1 Tax=Panagrellus redivivus TaxID=6233 RepID=FAR4_PANRE|nr:RecName: Full=FMRFamide-like neuropeptide PF4; AltName: Full=KPNFIRF-amide [Panagrellus redivivus]